MSDRFIYEFLYRGRPTSGPGMGDPAWHVVIGQFVAVPGKVDLQLVVSEPLTPQQAEVAGFPLSSVLTGIEAAALSDRDMKIADLAEAQSRLDAVSAERDRLQEQLAALTAAPAVAIISDRQFFQALALAGDITRAEALAAVMTGTMPARIEAAVLALPEDQRFAARMLLSGATTFDRHHPMVALLGQILGKDAAALDALWTAAATL